MGPVFLICVALTPSFLFFLRIWSFFLFVISVAASYSVIWRLRYRCARCRFHPFWSLWFMPTVLLVCSACLLFNSVVFFCLFWCLESPQRSFKALISSTTRWFSLHVSVVRTNTNSKFWYWRSIIALYLLYGGLLDLSEAFVSCAPLPLQHFAVKTKYVRPQVTIDFIEAEEEVLSSELLNLGGSYRAPCSSLRQKEKAKGHRLPKTKVAVLAKKLSKKEVDTKSRVVACNKRFWKSAKLAATVPSHSTITWSLTTIKLK